MSTTKQLSLVLLKLFFAAGAFSMSWLNWWLLPQQTRGVGFAARTREPDYAASVFCIIGIAVGLAIGVWLLMHLRRNVRHGTAIAWGFVGLFVLSMYTYFASW